jgi:fructose-bisphosphate aldolase, class II
MLTLLEALHHADATGTAVGHFNISDLIALKAVFDAAGEKNLPVVVGVSEGERQFIGAPQVAALVKSLREEYNFPIFLNADHTHSLAKAIEAAKAGFDWVVFDLSTLPFEENLRQTKQAVEALKAIRPSILVEGEIGDIGSGSEIHDAAPASSSQLLPTKRSSSSKKQRWIPLLPPSVTGTG